MNLAAIILAAGGSQRMGQPKQLLPYDGQTLLRRAVTAALDSECQCVVVILGAHAEILKPELANTSALTVINPRWAEGMGSSIRCGINEVTKIDAEVSGVLLMLCDQPLVEVPVIDRLIRTYREKRVLVVASQYESKGETVCGVPAIFSRELFQDLANLSGPNGAKTIINKYKEQAAFVSMPEAALDVDTTTDYLLLQRLSVAVSETSTN